MDEDERLHITFNNTEYVMSLSEDKNFMVEVSKIKMRQFSRTIPKIIAVRKKPLKITLDSPPPAIPNLIHLRKADQLREKELNTVNTKVRSQQNPRNGANTFDCSNLLNDR